jgi:CPA1 family monovalent cation:H+ antiporter
VIGIWLTNQDDFDVEHVIEFKENLRTLLIGCLFIVLGSRVDVQDILEVGWRGLAFLAVLIVLVRPISVFVSLAGSALNRREQTFIAALAPRGIVAAAVSSVFTLKMQSHADMLAIGGAEQLATITFLVIVGTVAVYGVAAMPLARSLGLADESTNGVLIAGADSWICDFALELKKASIPVLLVDTNYAKVSSARVAGLEAVCANILNEHVRDDLPLNGIGTLMAMTENDEINSLAVRECRHLFDRANLYQLTFTQDNRHHRRGMAKKLMGRALFGADATSHHLREMHEAGAEFKSTALTQAFDYQNFLDSYGETVSLMCVIEDDKTLMLNTVAEPISPAAGQTVVTLVAATPVPENHAIKRVDEESDL